MENFEEKMGRKTFLSVFGWVGRKEINDGVQVFSPQAHQKVFSPK